MTELVKTWNWQQFGAVTVDEAIAAMQAMIDNYYDGCASCTLPGGGKIIRVNANGHVEELSGDEWIEPTGDYAVPPLVPREGGTPDDQICLAAKNAVNVLEQLYEVLSEAFADNLSTAEALTAIIAAIIGAIGAAFALITAAIAAFFLAVFELLYRALAYITADLWTEDFTKQLTCILVGCATNTDGVITFDNECFNDAMTAQINDFALNEAQLRLYVQIGYILMFIGGMDGLNAAANTTEITNDDCSFCDQEWSYRLYPDDPDFGDMVTFTNVWVFPNDCGWYTNGVINGSLNEVDMCGLLWRMDGGETGGSVRIKVDLTLPSGCVMDNCLVVKCATIGIAGTAGGIDETTVTYCDSGDVILADGARPLTAGTYELYACMINAVPFSTQAGFAYIDFSGTGTNPFA